jgi:hypothetical protein
VALLAATAAGAAWLVRRDPTHVPRPALGATLLEETIDLPAAGVSRRLRVNGPGTLVVAVVPPEGKAVRVALGPAQPVERAPVDAPDPATTTTWTARRGDPPRSQVTLVAGLYVLRLEPEGGAAAGAVALTVRASPEH